MRFWFSFILFIFSVAYFVYGLNALNFITPFGRPGPGYFPALVGGGLILATVINLVKDILEIRQKNTSIFSVSALSAMSGTPLPIDDQKDSEETGSSTAYFPKDVLLVVALIAALITMLPYLGGLVSMALFMWVLLATMNRGKWMTNTVFSLLLPLFLYLLFDVWLNASLPIGVFGF